MAEGIPVDQANVLTLKIQELEQTVRTLESDKRQARLGEANRQKEVDQLHFAAERADEVYMAIIDKLLTRLEDR